MAKQKTFQIGDRVRYTNKWIKFKKRIKRYDETHKHGIVQGFERNGQDVVVKFHEEHISIVISSALQLLPKQIKCP